MPTSVFQRIPVTVVVNTVVAGFVDHGIRESRAGEIVFIANIEVIFTETFIDQSIEIVVDSVASVFHHTRIFIDDSPHIADIINQ